MRYAHATDYNMGIITKNLIDSGNRCSVLDYQTYNPQPISDCQHPPFKKKRPIQENLDKSWLFISNYTSPLTQNYLVIRVILFRSQRVRILLPPRMSVKKIIKHGLSIYNQFFK